MAKNKFKFMTLLMATFCLLASLRVHSANDLVIQENLKSHLRWNFFVNKDEITISKKNNRVIIKTLNSVLLNKIFKSLSALDLTSGHISKIEKVKKSDTSNLENIIISLALKDVEIFNFYRDREKKYVLDFWKNKDDNIKVTNISNNPKKVKVVYKKPSKKVKKVSANLKKSQKKKTVKTKKNDEKISLTSSPDFRDFRYGASFIWDYEPLKPELKNKLKLDRKTPEYYFPITDREFQKDEKEAHLQLSINLFRKKKYGLMYKSITLYNQKYGEDKNFSFNEYLKANAILRENLNKGNREPIKSAITTLEIIAKKTNQYEMSKGIMKYLIYYYTNKGEWVKSLDIAKRFYILSKENYDYEESPFAVEVILLSLSNLNQIEKISELLKEKTIKKILPGQIATAYQIYSFIKVRDVDSVIELYNQKKSAFMKPVHEIILFNTAEAFFRKGEYKNAIKLFDDYLKDYSYQSRAAQARLRIALSYEILERDINQTLSLYKNAINRSQDFMTRYEAQIRYVALNSIRRKKVNEKHLETRIFLKNDKNIEIKDKRILKLLWLVRLRSFINDREYLKALTYLKSLPLNTMKLADLNVFEADGAEIISGLILQNFKKSNFSKVVNLWEIYKGRYLKSVAIDPTVNYAVAKSMIKLGLYSSFDDLYASFKKNKDIPFRNYPIWFDRAIGFNVDNLLVELQIIRHVKLENWKLVEKLIEKLKFSKEKVQYYRSLVRYANKNYKEAINSSEKYFSISGAKKLLDQEELARIFHIYSDSLYQSGKLLKFKKVAKAILDDSKDIQIKSEYLGKVRERISYLRIEVLSADNKVESSLLLENEITDFKKLYPKSNYIGRLNYLLGVNYISNKRENEGREILNSVLDSESVNDYIKELARSELSYLELKNKTI